MRFAQTTPLLQLAAVETKAAPQNAKAAPAGPVMTRAQAAQARILALALADRFIIPSYRALVQATDTQEKAWIAFAAKRETADIQPLIAAYGGACDAWASVQ